VPRPPDDDLRAALLDRAVDYVCKHGLSELSLRPLAKALRTSAALLHYHFGSKDDLIAAIIEAGRARQVAAMQQLELQGDLSTAEVGRILWRAWSDARWEPLIMLFFEVYALALRDRSRFPGFLESAIEAWLRPLQATLPDPDGPRARALATVTLDGFRGFLLDLCATHDRVRIDAAVELWLAMLEHAETAPEMTRRFFPDAAS